MSTPATNPDTARTVAVSTIKGGVGKTSLSAAISAEAARLGARVLAIDFDPNAALTTSQFGFDVTNDDATIGDVLIDGRPGAAADALLAAPGDWQPNPDLPWARGGAFPGGGLAFIPASTHLDAALTEISHKPASEQRLATVLRGVASQFDLVIVDSGPRSDRITWLVLMAAGHVLSATLPESQSLDGVQRSIGLIDEFTPYRPDLRMLGTVITRYDSRYPSRHGKQVRQARALHDHPEVAQEPVGERAPFARVTHPGTPGVVPDTQSGCVVFPEIIPAASYTLGAHDERQPIHYGLLPRDGEPVDLDGLSYMRRQEIEKARQHTLRYTRLALRVLAATGSPAIPRIAENLSTQPIPGLWDEKSLRGDGTTFAADRDVLPVAEDDTTEEEQ